MTVIAVDTSVAIPLLLDSHTAHAEVAAWARGRRLALAGHAVAVPDEAQEQVLRAHIRVVEFLGFPVCHCQDFAHPGGVRDVALRLGFRAPAYLFLHLFAHGGKLHAQIFQDGDGHALAQFEKAEKKVFGSYIVMIEAVRFPARVRQYLLRPGRKVIHICYGKYFLVALASGEFLPDDVRADLVPVFRACLLRGGQARQMGRLDVHDGFVDVF